MSQTADAESETGSICDEERVRKLFQACDGDGDGFIDSQDLLTVCRELNLENSVEELMRELGADEHGRISYQEFLRRRLALRPEIEALRSGKHRTSPHHTHTPEYLPTSSDNSLGTVSGRHESWEFDSGARDLSPEPHTLQKLVEAAAGGSGNMLDLANKLHAAALSSLRSEVADLNSRLLIATRAREAAEVALARAEVQAARAEQRAEQQAARHEERLTELHSVIAELGRQLERHRATVIAEEDESEDLKIGCIQFVEIETSRDAEGSITNPVEESEGGGDIQGDGDRTLGDADSSCCEEIEHRTNENGREQLDSPAALPTPEPTQPAASCQSVAVATLQEEVTALRAEIVSLQAQLAQFKNQGQNGNQGQLNGDSPRREHKTRGNTSSPEPLTAPCSPLLPPLQTPPTKSVTREEPPVLKMAERVRLRRTDERHITGPDITNLGVCSTMVAEHLVSDLLEQSNLQELNGSEKQFEVETERLNSRLEHARANNAVLALTLHESKAQCDRLSLLVGKYESNAMALRLALSYSDRAIEAYDVLVALLESEIALSTERNSLTIDNRKAAENVAYHMLNRLENDCANVMGAPWEDSIILSDESEVTWTVENEERLRRHLSRLKGDRAMVRSTAVELESVHVEPLNSKNTISLAEARKLDLETAVLMQELMAMREDKAELRARVFLLEKERATIELKLNAQETQIAAQHAAIEHLQGQLNDTEAMLSMNKDRGLSDNESEGIESELIEALGREARLKERLQELVSTLDKVNKNSELRHQQSAELVNDLKKANSALVQTLEKTKKKYQSRLKKLEQQMLGMVERHTAQVKSLKQRIALLEEEAAVYKGTLPLQSQSSGASETSL
ncbi:colorectal mutant cancer protein-like isoform X3 [Vespa mandarinia]|uniref:colorectal mutant cancer protein-like isoform X3 n=1 Tax=Vespa mandarinia TaxID=7446 RepID=UPI0016118395|nr:colorectal mutant cancer protein-like isoform X3 [Vespa mandarinia]XP_035737068.1 colorectal mutant cancer protein-like isoform X3 [Vespa mandarinia]XP_035737069.1 colorectal mutant cancer protein-like isoform X3 [Vespa mandarinia]XP_035737070.1 colorectal mutant cancer protein-like isoform X3 [Vespa mandarinia]XP_035737071.1 colorectal mutant cancer protein-like isoform X3 [Vespa mandarinia]XP_047351397.1 colorectal mutant cancer protein isoform X3 [Vespa velutina]XP_047351398.1 colorecta